MTEINGIEVIEHDVLIIGAGGAGLRAAIAASDSGADCGIVCKSLLGKAHTVMAEGGMAAALANVASKDSWKVHFRDTMRGGKFLNQWRMAEIHAQESPDRVLELEEWGAVFDRTKDGLINQRNFGGHRHPRLAHVGDRTGLELLRTLQDHAIHRPKLKVHMECTVLSLIKDGDAVCGAVAYWRDTGKFAIFKAGAVVMATGGGGKAWQITSNSWEYTGDGFQLAYDAGAELMDLEFTQFHPTGMVWPPSVRGLLVTEGVRGDGGILLNKDNQRFMFNYIPEKFAAETAANTEEGDRWFKGDKEARRPAELLTRDVVARSIVSEIKAGRGSKHGGVFLDIATRLPAETIKAKLPSMYHQFYILGGLDITKEPMEVGPTLHYFMGGIRVEWETQQSSVPGLFACGECAAGLHGANRLGGNSLTDLLVFGRRAGMNAADYAGKRKAVKIDEAQVLSAIKFATDILNRESGENPYLLHEELQQTMQDNVGIVRTAEELKKAASDIGKLKEKTARVKAAGTSQYNPAWHEALSMNGLLITSEAVTRCALQREESRGGHTRLDFPGEREDGLTYNSIVRKTAAGMSIEKRMRAEAPAELKNIATANIDDLEAGKI